MSVNSWTELNQNKGNAGNSADRNKDGKILIKSSLKGKLAVIAKLIQMYGHFNVLRIR